jgi:hypothetical protein
MKQPTIIGMSMIPFKGETENSESCIRISDVKMSPPTFKFSVFLSLVLKF